MALMPSRETCVSAPVRAFQATATPSLCGHDARLPSALNITCCGAHCAIVPTIVTVPVQSSRMARDGAVSPPSGVHGQA